MSAILYARDLVFMAMSNADEETALSVGLAAEITDALETYGLVESGEDAVT